MSAEITAKWKQLFLKNCKQWDGFQQQRYFNIPNDPTDVDEEELAACRELITEINGKPPVE